MQLTVYEHRKIFKIHITAEKLITHDKVYLPFQHCLA